MQAVSALLTRRGSLTLKRTVRNQRATESVVAQEIERDFTLDILARAYCQLQKLSQKTRKMQET